MRGDTVDKEYEYKYTENCWFKGSCPREAKQGCDPNCNIQAEFSYLLNTSNIPKDYMKSVTLYPDDADYEAFKTLATIKQDIESFVDEGRFLYIWGKSTGTGKTNWSTKLLKTYLAVKCVGNNFADRGWFEYVPSFLLLAKEFENPEARKEHIDNTMKRDLVILDDIGAVQNSNYDISTLSNIIDYRYSNGLATIITGNIEPAKLESSIGVRLADRVLSDIAIEFKGGSNRSYTNTYVRKG